jgi:hypothetical protein
MTRQWEDGEVGWHSGDTRLMVALVVVSLALAVVVAFIVSPGML